MVTDTDPELRVADALARAFANIDQAEATLAEVRQERQARRERGVDPRPACWQPPPVEQPHQRSAEQPGPDVLLRQAVEDTTAARRETAGLQRDIRSLADAVGRIVGQERRRSREAIEARSQP
jgi:hypothetical protein